MPLGNKPFENTVGKGEIDRNEKWQKVIQTKENTVGKAEIAH